MAKSYHLLLFFITQTFVALHGSDQSQTILQIQQLLNLPLSSPLDSLSSNSTDYSTTEPTPSLSLSFYQENITQLHISGIENEKHTWFSSTTSLSLFASISNLKSLKILSLPSLGLRGPLPPSIGYLTSLEILDVSFNYFSGQIPSELSGLGSLQTLILDHNRFSGQVPAWLGSLPVLTHLSVQNNSISGPLPISITRLQNLRIVDFSRNLLTGELPDFSNLTNLQVLDFENNRFGPRFPSLNKKLVSLSLRNNSFKFGVPHEIASYDQLQKLDISLNRFVGPFPPSLFSLPSINYLDISENKLTGFILRNMSCSPELIFVNLSSNFLTGNLPSCLELANETRTVQYANNCLSNKEQEQHPFSFCQTEALAVQIPSDDQKPRKRYARPVIASSIVGGIAFVGLVSIMIKHKEKLSENCRYKKQDAAKATSTRLIIEKVSAVHTAKLLTDARYISKTMKLGAGLPAYRTFTLEELKEATDNFDATMLIYNDSNGQVYKGKLVDGTLVAIRRLKTRKWRSQQSYTNHIEMFTRLRNSNLVSSLGHCFEKCPNDSTVSFIYLIFEFVPNGTLRRYVSEGIVGQSFNWMQRIGAAIGIANGMQFLHSRIGSGVFNNDIKIKDVLLDQNLHVKISCYSLPLSAEIQGASGPKTSSGESQAHGSDVYNMGVILLEMIMGRPINSINEVMVAKDLLTASTGMDDSAQRSIVDPEIVKEASDESLKMVSEICLKSLSDTAAERPSLEDILWNLQFAAQLQSSVV